MVANKYEKQGLDFLAKHSITFNTVLIGNDCPPFCEDARNGKDMDLVDKFPRRSHIHGKHYRVTFHRDNPDTSMNSAARATYGKNLIVDFWNSYADEEYNVAFHNQGSTSYALRDKYAKEIEARKRTRQLLPLEERRTVAKVPTPYDVLTCLTKSDLGTFDDFCSEFGYDNDSIRARTTWEACVEEWRKTRMFFTSEELEGLQEIQ